MKKTFEDESDALSTSPATPTTNQSAATTPPSAQATSGSSDETPVPVAGNGAPDYSQVELNTQPDLPTPDKAGGSATEPESGGGYSG
ncbi:hypothetical protein [Hymenobacter sp. UYP22]|uniref:hypothetical protein n=1 Tax=Hymenobacter sp. UYP22 TaxID=3156348 RepID=UPI003390F388